MAIRLISKEHNESICALFDEVESSIKIISPFIGREMANLLIDAKSQNPELEAKLITRFYSGDFIAGVSKIRSIKEMHDCGVEIYALKGLHTKLYLFDTNAALLGSANFTSGGFKFNHELSLYITNEPEINAEMVAHFDDLIKAIVGKGAEFLLTTDIIEKEMQYVSEKLEQNRDKSISYFYGKKYGAELPSYKFDDAATKLEPVDDPIQDIISTPREATSDYDGTIWLKFIGETDSRFSLSEKYYPQVEDGYPAGIVCYPTTKKPSSVKNGDYIYIAAVSMDERGRTVLPYIVGRGITDGFHSKNTATPAMLEAHPWMARFMNFCAFTEFEYIDASIGECIPLVEVLQELRSDTYASTMGNNIGLDRLRRQHSQKAHLRLTSVAKEFIDDAFDKAAKEYGVHKLTDTRAVTSAPKLKTAPARAEGSVAVTEDMIETAYKIAKMVYDRDIGRTEGRSMIAEQSGMSEGTAGDHIEQFLKMRDGDSYSRTLSAKTAQIYFNNIHEDFGDEGLRKALDATRQHVEYYESLPTGARRHNILSIMEEFETKLFAK